jgi:hypothetical protein
MDSPLSSKKKGGSRGVAFPEMEQRFSFLFSVTKFFQNFLSRNKKKVQSYYLFFLYYLWRYCKMKSNRDVSLYL